MDFANSRNYCAKPKIVPKSYTLADVKTRTITTLLTMKEDTSRNKKLRISRKNQIIEHVMTTSGEKISCHIPMINECGLQLLCPETTKKITDYDTRYGSLSFRKNNKKLVQNKKKHGSCTAAVIF